MALTRKVLMSNGSVMSYHRVIEITNNYQEGGFTRIEVASWSKETDISTMSPLMTPVVIPLDDTMRVAEAEAWLTSHWPEYIDPAEEALTTLLPTLSDEQAVTIPTTWWPIWDAATTYDIGNRVIYSGSLYRCVQAHTAQEAWNPKDASSLWAHVLTIDPEDDPENPTTIPEWTQPDSTNPYMAGDKVIFNGVIYQSKVDNNTWSPEDYPDGWEVVETGETGETDIPQETISEWTQPDSTNPYMTGDKVIFNGVVYQSLIDNNAWSPADYPAGWQVV